MPSQQVPHRFARGLGAAAPVGVFVGLATLDVLHRVERVPGPNEKVTATRQDIAAGGPAANAAVVFAALGGRARLITSLGSHPIAAVIGADLAAEGVDVQDVTPELPAAPAVSAVCITGGTGERSVVSIDGAGRTVPEPATLAALMDGAEVVLIDGHHPVLALAAARLARRQGTTVVVDAGRWKPVMADLLPLADDVICSADFRWPGTDTTDDSAAAVVHLAVPTPPAPTAPPAAPAAPPSRLVAVTAGARPITWWHAGRTGSVQVPAVTAVDTLGAGDALHGAYALLRTDTSRSIPDRLTGAARVAALRCSIIGPRMWLRGIGTLHLGVDDG